MSGIAEILLSLGHQVTGSDLAESPRTQNLRQLGARIFIGHHEDNLHYPTVVVYSSAIKENNPEIIGAQKRKIPLMKRAEMLAELMRLKKKRHCHCRHSRQNHHYQFSGHYFKRIRAGSYLHYRGYSQQFEWAR